MTIKEKLDKLILGSYDNIKEFYISEEEFEELEREIRTSQLTFVPSSQKRERIRYKGRNVKAYPSSD